MVSFRFVLAGLAFKFLVYGVIRYDYRQNINAEPHQYGIDLVDTETKNVVRVRLRGKTKCSSYSHLEEGQMIQLRQTIAVTTNSLDMDQSMLTPFYLVTQTNNCATIIGRGDLNIDSVFKSKFNVKTIDSINRASTNRESAGE